MFSCNEMHARCWCRLMHVYFLAYFSSANELLLPLSFLYGLHIQKFCPGKESRWNLLFPVLFITYTPHWIWFSFGIISIHTKTLVVQALRFLTRIREVPDLNPGLDIVSSGLRLKYVLFLSSLKKIPGRFRVVRLRSLPSLSFPVCYVDLPAFKVVGTFWENDVVKTAPNKYSSTN